MWRGAHPVTLMVFRVVRDGEWRVEMPWVCPRLPCSAHHLCAASACSTVRNGSTVLKMACTRVKYARCVMSDGM